MVGLKSLPSVASCTEPGDPTTRTCTETLTSHSPFRGLLFILTFPSGFFDLEIQAHTPDLPMQRHCPSPRRLLCEFWGEGP
ncbi:hypothetical protein QQF64_032143 [Cirrhinus molitorella]|uniref:Uncharacterized protein n=1 Tax=Cirrhinus molitorella TaxID=172907 RepID=A0ABR3MYY6_9TELE